MTDKVGGELCVVPGGQALCGQCAAARPLVLSLSLFCHSFGTMNLAELACTAETMLQWNLCGQFECAMPWAWPG